MQKKWEPSVRFHQICWSHNQNDGGLIQTLFPISFSFGFLSSISSWDASRILLGCESLHSLTGPRCYRSCSPIVSTPWRFSSTRRANNLTMSPHSSLLVATDADSVSVPVALLPSKNENLAVVSIRHEAPSPPASHPSLRFPKAVFHTRVPYLTPLHPYLI